MISGKSKNQGHPVPGSLLRVYKFFVWFFAPRSGVSFEGRRCSHCSVALRFSRLFIKNTHDGTPKERRRGGESPVQASRGVPKAGRQIPTKIFAAESYDDLIRVPWRTIQRALQRVSPSQPCIPSTIRFLRTARGASTSLYGSRPLPLPWFHFPTVLRAQGSGFESLDPSISARGGGPVRRIRTMLEPVRAHDGVHSPANHKTRN